MKIELTVEELEALLFPGENDDDDEIAKMEQTIETMQPAHDLLQKLEAKVEEQQRELERADEGRKEMVKHLRNLIAELHDAHNISQNRLKEIDRLNIQLNEARVDAKTAAEKNDELEQTITGISRGWSEAELKLGVKHPLVALLHGVKEPVEALRVIRSLTNCDLQDAREMLATLDQKYTGTYRNLLVQLGRLCCAKAMRDEEPEVEQPLPLSSSS